MIGKTILILAILGLINAQSVTLIYVKAFGCTPLNRDPTPADCTGSFFTGAGTVPLQFPNNNQANPVAVKRLFCFFFFFLSLKEFPI
jgi:hypothetical protein